VNLSLVGAADHSHPRKNKSKGDLTMQKYECACGYVYDPAAGDPDNGVAPGTPFENLPEDWACPVCGLEKSFFTPA